MNPLPGILFLERWHLATILRHKIALMNPELELVFSQPPAVQPKTSGPKTSSRESEPEPPSFQASSTIQGRRFAEQCDDLLLGTGFKLGKPIVLASIGVEIDQDAISPNGNRIWFEYKGSIQGNRPGLIRTDTVKKAVANGALIEALGSHPPYVVLTSHLPIAGAALAMLNAARTLGYLADVICVYDPAQVARLKSL